MFISGIESWKLMETKSPTNSQINLIEKLTKHQFIAFFCEKEDCSLFKESHFLENRAELGLGKELNLSVCSFDYIYLNLKNQPEINAKNIDYINHLINENIFKIVFNNQQIIIAKKILKGESCESKFES
jgi:hypothetical protein